MMSLRRRWLRDARPPRGAPPHPLPLPPHELLVEHALLVARGVRVVALIGGIESNPATMWYVHERLLGISVDAGDKVIPFVIDVNNGIASCGFAAAEWAIDLLRFALTSKQIGYHKDRVIGMLLGYSAESIQRYELVTCGAVFGPASPGCQP